MRPAEEQGILKDIAVEVFEARLVQQVSDLLLSGLTLDEIARALDQPLKTIKVLRRQAVKSWRESAAESYSEFALTVNARLQALLATVWAKAVGGSVLHFELALSVIKCQMRLMELAPGIADADQLSADNGGPLEALESQFRSIVERRLAAAEGGRVALSEGSQPSEAEVA